MLKWLNASLKSTETRDELSTTLYLQSETIYVMSRCLSATDATSNYPGYIRGSEIVGDFINAYNTFLGKKILKIASISCYKVLLTAYKYMIYYLEQHFSLFLV